MTLVLASASEIRRTVLTNAGVAFTVDPAAVDEDAIKAELRRQGAPTEMAAVELATAKANTVSSRHPGMLVLGADQMLEIGTAWLDKPADRGAARQHLETLSGRRHRLVSGVVVVEDGREVWRYADSVALQMRPLSPAFIESYLDRVGPGVLKSVGAYQLEGLGAQLFERIDGDYFTVLGMPLLPLLAFLRSRGVIPT